MSIRPFHAAYWLPFLAWLGLLLAHFPASGAASALRQVAAPGCGTDANAVQVRVQDFEQHHSFDQLVGQLFMVGLRSGEDPTRVDQLIRDGYAGNVVLYGSDWNGAGRVRSVADELQTAAKAANGSVGLFISGNQEGGAHGSFQAFYGPGFDDIPTAVDQGQLGSDTLRGRAATWGQQLRAAGVNLDLAPVLDTVPDAMKDQNAPIGYWARELGSDPAQVAEHGLAIIEGLHAGGVAVAAKHFPGLGRVTGNTDFTAQGTVDNDLSGFADSFLMPYKLAAAPDAGDAGTDFMMVSSAIYPQLDNKRAMFSWELVTHLLRQQLGFQGVVISDDVGAAAAVADVSVKDRALHFFGAGGDMVLTVEPGDIAPMVNATLAAMDADPAFAQQIEDSVTRVLTAKANYGLLPGGCQAQRG